MYEVRCQQKVCKIDFTSFVGRLGTDVMQAPAMKRTFKIPLGEELDVLRVPQDDEKLTCVNETQIVHNQCRESGY